MRFSVRSGRNNFIEKVDICHICGHEFSSDVLNIVVHENNRHVGYLCPKCLKAGPERMRRKILKLSEYLMKRAKYLKTVSLQKIKYLSWKEWEENLKDRKAKIRDENKDLDPALWADGQRRDNHGKKRDRGLQEVR